MAKTSVDLLIFDLDGTLIESKWDIAKSVNLTLQSSRLKLRGLQRGATLNVRGGECDISDSTGPLDVTAMNSETTVTAHDGTIQVGGEGGSVHLRAPGRDTKVDMRRADVELQITAPVSVAALTTFCFRERGMHRVEIVAAEGNRRSRAIPERLGFVREANLRARTLAMGGFRDAVLYAVLEREWDVEGGRGPGSGSHPA